MFKQNFNVVAVHGGANIFTEMTECHHHLFCVKKHKKYCRNENLSHFLVRFHHGDFTISTYNIRGR